MRKLLNTLYVTNPDSYLARDGENVVVRIGNEIKFRMPIHNIEGIVSFGYIGASPSLMGLCAERGVALTFLTETGRFLASVQGPLKGNILLRKQQYKVAESEAESLLISQNLIVGKISNSRAVLQRAIRDHDVLAKNPEMKRSVDYLSRQIEKAQRVKSLDQLRGLEGDSAKCYFGVFDFLILKNKDDFYFHGRTRRPPLDNVNALLSFLYTMLTHDIRAALETVGLDPAAGFFHQPRPGRPSLALDLIEELRAYLVDRLVLSAINLKQVDGKGFVLKESGGVVMNQDTRKEIIAIWQKRKKEIITHPFLNEKIEIGLLPYVQALLLARHLRGDLGCYAPFFWR
jgi:CRISPR-associated protein Cas1